MAGSYGNETGFAAKKKQFTDLEGNISQGIQGAKTAYGNQQQAVAGLPNQLEAARQAGLASIRAGGANALAAAGGPAAQAGSGGYGALLQAGQSGGIQAAQFGANSTIDGAKAMMAANSQLGQAGAQLSGLATEGYNTLQEAGGSLAAMSEEELAQGAAAMSEAFAEYDGVYNTDAEEAAYEAAMADAIASATDPAVRQQLIAMKKEYDRQFYGTGELTKK